MTRHRDTIEILVTARHLEAQGIRPTPRMLRLALGGGSPSAIARAMATGNVTPLETLIERRHEDLDREILATRRHLAELEAELARLNQLAGGLPSPVPSD